MSKCTGQRLPILEQQVWTLLLHWCSSFFFILSNLTETLEIVFIVEHIQSMIYWRKVESLGAEVSFLMMFFTSFINFCWVVHAFLKVIDSASNMWWIATIPLLSNYGMRIKYFLIIIKMPVDMQLLLDWNKKVIHTFCLTYEQQCPVPFVYLSIVLLWFLREKEILNRRSIFFHRSLIIFVVRIKDSIVFLHQSFH